MDLEKAISVKNVSKKYRLFNSPKERIYEALHPLRKKFHKEFWALKDVTFDVAKGSTVGIVGRNGSGKSTLLQIICSVLRPTSGNVAVNGKISALLELGAGFNPELTGRQNVLLNGTMAGFSKEEMQDRMPIIERFAEIDDFIDQPVKLYSSGMFIRLAFSAAINVNPDILIVDEALAVGDAKFQYKCYAKFQEFQKLGKTILFVTHNTDAVVKHCNFSVLIENGRMIESGEPKSVTNYYLDILFTGRSIDFAPQPVQLEEAYNGYNIIHFGSKYYAFLQLLGAVKLDDSFENRLDEWRSKDYCLIGTSLNEVKQLVDDKVLAPEENSDTRSTESNHAKKDAQIDQFIKETQDVDNCINRKNYNKNEYRYGDKRAQIVDYLITTDRECDPVSILSGEEISIYVKIKFFDKMPAPMTGIGIKSVDGIDVFGINTKGMNLELPPIDDLSVVAVFKWSLPLNLSHGDYFIDIGCGEYNNGDSIPLDRRFGIAHLTVQSADMFAGFVKLETKFERIC